MPAAARGLARHLGAIVAAMMSWRPGALRATDVRCRHHGEGHRGVWKDCERCPRDFETEIYVYYGTNEYNFEQLENPPAYEPTRCSECQAVIVLPAGSSFPKTCV